MVDRVLIQPNGLAAMRVSLPGHNVHTAAMDQLVFDARFSGYRLYLRGETRFILNGATQDGTSVWFGETLATPPICFATIDYNLDRVKGGPFYTPNWLQPLYARAGSDFYDQKLFAYAYRDRVLFWGSKFFDEVTWVDVRYTIYRLQED